METAIENPPLEPNRYARLTRALREHASFRRYAGCCLSVTSDMHTILIKNVKPDDTAPIYNGVPGAASLLNSLPTLIDNEFVPDSDGWIIWKISDGTVVARGSDPAIPKGATNDGVHDG